LLENLEYTESEGFRFERKYVGNSVDIRNSEMIIKMNPAGFSPVFSERFINNIKLSVKNAQTKLSRTSS